MPALNITKTYADTQILNEIDLDNIITDVETFLNTTKIDSDNIQDGGVLSPKLADSAVTSSKINDLAVLTSKLAASAVTTAKIADDAVTSNKLATGSVLTDALADDNVTSDKLDTNIAIGGTLEVGLDAAVTPPILSREGTSKTLEIDEKIRLKDINGPLLSSSAVANNVLQVEDRLQIGASGPNLRAVSSDSLRILNNSLGNDRDVVSAGILSTGFAFMSYGRVDINTSGGISISGSGANTNLTNAVQLGAGRWSIDWDTDYLELPRVQLTVEAGSISAIPTFIVEGVFSTGIIIRHYNTTPAVANPSDNLALHITAIGGGA